MEEKVQSLTQNLIDQLGFKATVDVNEDDGVYVIHIKTDEDASMLIGKHARMLASLQRVLGAMMFKQMEEKVDILVDVNDYREAQKERLIGIADNVARRVLDENRSAQLSSFSAYERKIIHEHISTNYLSLESFSEGEGRYRKLVIRKKEGIDDIEDMPSDDSDPSESKENDMPADNTSLTDESENGIEDSDDDSLEPESILD